MNYRKERLENLITELLGKELVKKIETPGVLITIVNSELNDNMEAVHVYLSIFPDGKEKEVIKEVKKRTPEFQYYLMKKLRMKKIPTLIFK